ncbi:glycosyltransferase [Cohnella endophytica]|uniref:Glycosyltransferase n=2 Tax=Cohnella endophytica TaxID=2419778 RepID=A0A494XA77_9BACL|nr:glycosyltransferase [Cohnella endophytica]
MKTISLVMIVLNESDKLKRCLESVHDIVDEMIVVDTGSSDNSKEIALSYRAKVYDFTWTQSFADARNFALSHSTSDWNLTLDADEYISNDCALAIRTFINRKDVEIGRIKKVNKVMHKDGESYENSYTSRLFPAGIKYSGRIHEQIDSDLPRVKIDVEVQHDGYFEIKKSDRNIPILQMELRDHPNSSYYLYQLAKEYNGLGNFAEANSLYKKAYRLISRREIYAPNLIVDYIYNIVAGGLYEEGIEVIQEKQQFIHDYPDYHFACGVFYLEYILSDVAKNAHLLNKIEESYLKCIEIGETEKYDSVIGTGSFVAYYNLGTYYEVVGNIKSAEACYRKSAEYDYQPALSRLQLLSL